MKLRDLLRQLKPYDEDVRFEHEYEVEIEGDSLIVYKLSVVDEIKVEPV